MGMGHCQEIRAVPQREGGRVDQGGRGGCSEGSKRSGGLGGIQDGGGSEGSGGAGRVQKGLGVVGGGVVRLSCEIRHGSRS